MIISSRQNPPKMSLRKTPTRSTFGPTPLSEHSLKIPLIDSPLPSPGLPSIVPRHGKKPTPRWKRKLLVVRLFLWITSALATLRFALIIFPLRRSPDATTHVLSDGKAYEMVGADTLPEQPIPIVVTDQHGKSRWTVSVPHDLAFPLSPSDYSNLCAQCDEISRHVAVMEGHARQWDRHNYYHGDPSFLDVVDAEEHGMLPTLVDRQQQPISGRIARSENDDSAAHVAAISESRKIKVCKKSLTYVLQTEDAGLGRTLLGLWMSYGLARKEGRSFFVDDTNWVYGKYTVYFQPPPKPDCLPPPPAQRVPCPHGARHLVVSTATAPWVFGDSFKQHFEDRRKTGAERQKPVFALLRTGYEALFQLADDDASYLKDRVEELKTSIRKKGGFQIGVHIRRGDLHPMEFQYRESYIPLEKYAATARRLLGVPFDGSSSGHTLYGSRTASKMILASDDPDIYDTAELRDAEKAQHRISLASKKALDAAAVSRGQEKKPVEENIGWEGGFFRDMFWSLGAPPSVPAAGSPLPSKRQLALRPRSEQIPSSDDFHFHSRSDALQLRELIGRAYLLDLAVLGQTDKVVCGVSSVACRLLAVMMGWDRAIVAGGWQNVDGSWDWNGIPW